MERTGVVNGTGFKKALSMQGMGCAIHTILVEGMHEAVDKYADMQYGEDKFANDHKKIAAPGGGNP